MIRPALAAGLLLLSWPVLAQDRDTEPPADPAARAPVPAEVSPAPATNPALMDPASGPAAPPPAAPAPPGGITLPPDPAASPPAPARLSTTAGPAITPPAPPLPPGLELLTSGALRFRLATDAPDAALRRALEELGQRFAQVPTGRVTVEVQVASHPRDASLARRLSLARGRTVKEALLAGGLPETRIDIRPLGRLDPPADLVDILPPGMRSTTTAR